MNAAREQWRDANLAPAGKPADRLGLDLTDEDNAERLNRAYGRDLIYVVGKGWGAWDGLRFDFHQGKWGARARAAKLRRLVEAEAVAARRSDIDDVSAQRWLKRQQRKGGQGALPLDNIEAAKEAMRKERADALRGFAVKCAARNRINAALELLEPKRVEPLDALDADPWRLACRNGVLDLRRAVGEPSDDVTGAEARAAALAAFDEALEAEEPQARAARLRACLEPADRSLRNTRTLGVDFDPEAECPAFDRFLALIMPDPVMRGFLLRALSLCLYGRNFAQVAILLRGAGGNGKSTLVKVFETLLDGYGEIGRVAMFLYQDAEKPGQANPEEVDIPGARALFVSEPKARDRLGADRIKQFTGGDRRVARALNQPQFKYTPHAVPIFQFNRTPEIPDEDEGTWRRLVFIPFDVNLRALPREQQRDPEEVVAELAAEGPGILNRLIEAFAAVRRIGLAPPKIAEEMKAELRSASDPVGEFVKQCCEFVADEDGAGSEAVRVQAKEFYGAYEAWCGANGYKPFSENAVRKLVGEKGYRRKTSGGKTYYLGLRIETDLRETTATQGEGGGGFV